jgi:hypothetical protein
MWLIHIHDNDTSAIDKYWIFHNKDDAIRTFKEMVNEYKDYLDLELLQELYDLEYESEESDQPNKISFEQFVQNSLDNIDENACVKLLKDDYLILTDIDNNGFGRRP